MIRNYTYIVASMPALSPDWRPEPGRCRAMLEWIKSQLSPDDAGIVEYVEQGFRQDDMPKEDFYRKAAVHRNRFVRSFFTADMYLKNAKVEYLNRTLGRPDGQDVLHIEDAGENTDRDRTEAIFRNTDLLSREREIDGYLWEKADEFSLFEYFSLDNILAIAAKLCIIERWASLDYETGRKLLRQLVKEVRGTYGKIEFHTFR